MNLFVISEYVYSENIYLILYDTIQIFRVKRPNSEYGNHRIFALRKDTGGGADRFRRLPRIPEVAGHVT